MQSNFPLNKLAQRSLQTIKKHTEYSQSSVIKDLRYLKEVSQSIYGMGIGEMQIEELKVEYQLPIISSLAKSVLTLN